MNIPTNNQAIFGNAAAGKRTSTTWYLPYKDAKELLKVASELTGLPASRFEEPQVVRYEMGEQFTWHYDAIPASLQKSGGNRLGTLLIYLNTLEAKSGGATCFKDLELHLTGPLQTNKVKNAIKIFDLFQTLDREKLANEFSKHVESIKNKVFFIQVNIGKEKNKSGIFPEEADDFIKYCMQDLKLNIAGLMCIPPINTNPTFYFKNLYNIAKGNNLIHLSMGMSGDYIDGLKCGASYIRVGTLLFGNR